MTRSERFHHPDITFTMQVLLFLGVALTLVVDTSTKSVRTTHSNEIGEPESPLKSVRQEPCEKKEDCKNGAECKESDVGKYCECKPGTEGSVCEDVPKCLEIDCGIDATCSYDVEKEEPVCQCNDKTLSFYPEILKCKKPCETKEDCKNGAECDKNDEGRLYCKCKPGTEGGVCENVPGCLKMECGIDATCGYDVKHEKAVCQCNDKTLSFNPEILKCKKPCITNDDCKNGAECDENYEGRLYCKCKPGTEGDSCEHVPECLEMDCGIDAKCGYDVELQRAVCQCDDRKLAFDPATRKCKRPCELEEYQRKCYELHRECESDENEKEGFKCVCRGGQTEDSKGNCVDICRIERNVRKCEAMGRVCALDENETDGFRCACRKGEVEDGKGNCAVCDCGENSMSCKYEDGKKVCNCYSGYEDNNGRCDVCNCGKNSWTCNFDDGKKMCDCYPSYGDKNGRCEDCDCGNDTFSCKFENEKKSCVCDFGYEDNNGKCEICDCGNNSFSCGFVDGKKVCNCHRFHGQKDGQCEICFCGLNATSCRYDGRGNKVCDCPEGAVEINGQCEKTPFPSTFGPIEIRTDETRNSSVEHSWAFTTLNRNSAASSTTARPTDGDPCYANPCQNGGTCLLIDNRSKCFCKKPYLGIVCETSPCDWNPCMNGGVCKIENEGVKCYCKEPFAGKFCESPIKLDAYVVTLVAASVFSAIVLIFVTCVLCQRCRVVGTS